jgi:hypothetical protein
MLDRVQIRRIRGPVCGIYTLLLELVLDLFRSMDRGIVLHEYKTVCVMLGDICVKYFDVGISRILMFLRLEVAVYSI